MGSVLLVEVPPEITSRVRDRLTEIRIDVAGEGGIATALGQPAGDLDALVVDSHIDEPVRVAEQAAAVYPDVTVLILCSQIDRERVAKIVRFSALVGRDVRCVVPSPEEPLGDLIEDAATCTRRRRRHRSVLAAVEAEADAARAPPSRLEERLQESEERFRLVVESVADPIVTLGPDGRIQSANAATEAVFGYSASELLGEPIEILMPESLRAAHTAAFSRYLQSGERRMPWTGIRLPGRHKSGQEIALELSFGEFAFDETRVFTGILRDLSERHREEEELRSEASRLKQSHLSVRRVLQEEFAEKETLEKLETITIKMDSGVSLEEVLEKSFEAFQTILPYERMGYAAIENDRRKVRSIWVRSMLPEIRIPVGYSAPLEGSSLQQMLETRRPRLLNDLEAYLRTHPSSENTRLIVAEGMRSSLTCPLLAMGRAVGFLFFSSIRLHAYTDAHVESFMRIAEHVAVIIERGRLCQQLIETQRELELQSQFIANIFGRYTSAAIVSQLLKSPKGLKMGGETRTVTVLFADLRGFTPLCAKLDPQGVVRLLNIHLSVMTDVIMAHGGTIDEFMGDGILVIFGAPVFADDDAKRALACSIAMQRAMDVVRKELSDAGLPALEMGIAVHTGTVVAGNIGSEKRAKYGIVGATVNLVTRIESFTMGGQILCTENTLRESGDEFEFEEGPEIKLKGVNEPVQTFSVRGMRVQPASQQCKGAERT